MIETREGVKNMQIKREKLLAAEHPVWTARMLSYMFLAGGVVGVVLWQTGLMIEWVGWISLGFLLLALPAALLFTALQAIIQRRVDVLKKDEILATNRLRLNGRIGLHEKIEI